MPIRVECTRCGRSAYFADNDAGLAVACLECGQHLRVPAATPVARAPMTAPSANEPPPLFANTPPHLMVAPTAQADAALPPPVTHRTAKPSQRPLRPARRRAKWRTFGLLLLLMGSTGLIVTWMRHRPKAGMVLSAPSAQTAATQSTSQPAHAAVVSAASPPTSSSIATTQANPASTPVLASSNPRPLVATASPIVNVAAPIPVLPTYTPAMAPVGFIGFDRLELEGRFHADSYDATQETYARDTAHASALLLSNGPIQLAGDGDIRGDVRSANGSVLKPSHHQHVSGSTDPLTARLNALPVALNPLAHDSANAALPAEFYQHGNLNIYGAHQLSLPGGVYYLNDVTIDSPATLRLKGPTTLLISGRLNLVGNIETCGSLPMHCRIRITGDKPVTVTHRNTLYLDLYAPRSAIDISGKGDLFGSIVGRTLRVSGTRPMHFDESLSSRR